MAYEVGTAHLRVVPSFDGVETMISNAAKKWATQAATVFGREFNDRVKDTTGKTPLGPGKPESQRQGTQTAGAFAEGFKRKLEATLRALPDIQLDADSSDAERKLAGIREDLAALAGKTIGVDIDSTDALRQVKRIESELDRLARDSADVQVRVDSVAAQAELASLAREVSRLDGRNVDVIIDTRGGAGARAMLSAVGSAADDAGGKVGLLAVLGAGLAPAIVPAAAAGAAALLGLGAAAAGAGAGVAVGILAFSGIGDAVSAFGDAEDDAQKNGQKLTVAQNAVHAAIGRVTDAEDNLRQVRVSGAQAAQQAVEAVEQAERGVSRAREESARSIQAADQRVTVAEQDLTRAQSAARDVTRDLTSARQAYREQMQDLDSSIKGNARAQRQANLDIARAKQELDKILSDPNSSELQREQAQLTYEQQVAGLEDLQTRGRRLAAEQKDQAKKGVEGSDQVRAARDKIAAADQRVADARTKLDDASRAADQARVDGARRIEDAERAVQQAQRAQRQTAQRNAQAIVQAQKQVKAAQEAVTAAQLASTQAGVDGAKKLEEALDGLGPTQVAFAKFIYGLKGQFESLREVAAAGLLPPVQRGLENLLRVSGGHLEDFVRRMSGTLGGIVDKTFQAFDGPAFRRFFSVVDRTAGPSLDKMATAGLNVAQALADILSSFEPFGSLVLDGIVDLTHEFAAWARELDKTQGFQDFLDYVTTNGPRVIDIVEGVALFIGKVLVAAAPIGQVLLTPLGLLVDVLNAIPTGVLTTLAAGILLVVGAVKAVNLVSSAATGLTTFQGKLQNIGKTAGGMKASLAGLTGFLGGPWGIALAAASVGIGYLVAKHQEQQQRIQGVTAALTILGQKYLEIGKQGKQGTAAATDALAELVRQNPDLQKLVLGVDGLGLSLEDLAEGAAGGAVKTSKAYQALSAAIDAGIARQQEIRRAAHETGIDIQGSALEEFNTIGKNIDRYKELRDAYVGNAGAIGDQIRLERILTGEQIKNSTATQKARTVLDVLKDSTVDATTKAQLFKVAVENQTSAKINTIEADEAANRSSIAWTKSLGALRNTLIANKGSLDKHTTAGLDNRDAIEAAATQIRNMTIQNIAAGTPLDQVTKKHNTRVAALIQEVSKVTGDKKATGDLIRTYAGVPEKVYTQYVSDDFTKVYNNARQLQFAQFALRMNMSPEDAAKAWQQSENARRQYESFGGSGRAQGGPITGPGTPTSDSIPMLLSDGEWVHRAAAVDYYGHGLMSAMNNMEIPRELFGRRANGGSVNDQGGPGRQGGKLFRDRFPVDFTIGMSKKQALDYARQAMFSGDLGSLKGHQGWKWEVAVVHKAFPGLGVYSTYRPGSRTLSGNRSYHSIGRAVDFEPKRPVAEWIAKNYGKTTKELITPWRNLMLYNGHPHKFSRAIEAQHGVFGNNAHIHWAYDDGGYIPPGYSTVYNGSGKPEPVFTDQQWQTIRGSGIASGKDVTVRLVADDGLFLGIVRGEIDDTLDGITNSTVYNK